jgi:hypothetical protein
VVTYLVSLPGVLEQRDGRRDTALAIAKCRGHSAVEQQLLEAGANPDLASFREGPASSSGRAPGGPGGWLTAEEEDKYCSWTPEERRSYRHGGEGSTAAGPPGLHLRGGGGRGRGRGRGGSQSQAQQRAPSKCPW